MERDFISLGCEGSLCLSGAFLSLSPHAAIQTQLFTMFSGVCERLVIIFDCSNSVQHQCKSLKQLQTVIKNSVQVRGSELEACFTSPS